VDDFPENMEQFVIALNTGMRSKEQFVRIDWSCVDLARKDLTIPKSKNGGGRHIYMTETVRAAFESLRQRYGADGVVPFASRDPCSWGRVKRDY
jgi:integrase